MNLKFLVLIFPKWHFFGELGHHPIVYIKLDNNWIPILKKHKFKIFHLFFNPWVNLFHAINNNLYQLLQASIDFENPEEIRATMAYINLENSIRYYILNYHSYKLSPDNALPGLKGRVPFKIVLNDLVSEKTEDWLISEVNLDVG